MRNRFLHDFFFKKALALAEECGIITADQYSQNLYAFKREIQKQVQPIFKNIGLRAKIVYFFIILFKSIEMVVCYEKERDLYV